MSISIHYTRHALEKFEILKRHGFEIDREKIEEVVDSGEPKVFDKKFRALSKNGIEVIGEMDNKIFKVLTFYPI